MRFLVGLSILALAACSGASSSDLFGAPPLATEDPSSTEPTPADDEPLSPSDPPHDAGVKPRDASALDAKADVEPDVVMHDAAVPQKCSFDSDCPVDGEVCNWRATRAPCRARYGATRLRRS